MLKLELPVIYRGIIPFVFLYLIALVIIAYIRQVSLWGVDLFMTKR